MGVFAKEHRTQAKDEAHKDGPAESFYQNHEWQVQSAQSESIWDDDKQALVGRLLSAFYSAKLPRANAALAGFIVGNFTSEAERLTKSSNPPSGIRSQRPVVPNCFCHRRGFVVLTCTAQAEPPVSRRL
jgi:hypothetical protein